MAEDVPFLEDDRHVMSRITEREDTLALVTCTLEKETGRQLRLVS